MGDQANFIITQPKSSDPSPKRINNIDPFGGSIVYVCAWEYGCVSAGGGGRDRLTSCTHEYLPPR